jgi:hypothetical protein
MNLNTSGRQIVFLHAAGDLIYIIRGFMAGETCHSLALRLGPFLFQDPLERDLLVINSHGKLNTVLKVVLWLSVRVKSFHVKIGAVAAVLAKQGPSKGIKNS